MPNWSLSRPAAFDIKVINPLNLQFIQCTGLVHWTGALHALDWSVAKAHQNISGGLVLFQLCTAGP